MALVKESGKNKNLVATIIFIIFLEFLMFYQIFLSPQVKRCVIITCKHVMYVSCMLPNNLRLKKVSKIHRMIPQCAVFLPKFSQSQQKTLEKQKLNLSHSALFQATTRVSLKYFVTDCSCLIVIATTKEMNNTNLARHIASNF